MTPQSGPKKGNRRGSFIKVTGLCSLSHNVISADATYNAMVQQMTIYGLKFHVMNVLQD